jgi:hypothetical protein
MIPGRCAIKLEVHSVLSSTGSWLDCATFPSQFQPALAALAVIFIRRHPTMLALLHMHCALGHSAMAILYLCLSPS